MDVGVDVCDLDIVRDPWAVAGGGGGDGEFDVGRLGTRDGYL